LIIFDLIKINISWTAAWAKGRTTVPTNYRTIATPPKRKNPASRVYSKKTSNKLKKYI